MSLWTAIPLSAVLFGAMAATPMMPRLVSWIVNVAAFAGLAWISWAVLA